MNGVDEINSVKNEKFRPANDKNKYHIQNNVLLELSEFQGSWITVPGT